MGLGVPDQLFLLTQYVQLGLGYSALEVTTVRYTVAAGPACIAAGLWLLSGITVASTYASIVPGIVLLGAGAGLARPAATESVMGSLPASHRRRRGR